LIEKLLHARVPLLACVVAAALAGGAYLYYEPTLGGGTIDKPSSLPGPAVSNTPSPSSSNLSGSKFDLDLTPAISAPASNAASNASSNAVRPAASGEKPTWCSEDHLKLDELAICATESLWALDSQLNEAFGKYSATVPDPKALSDDEAKWVRETRRPCGVDEQCLARAYHSRILYFTASMLKR
jgi:uncharacterized protein YecT (DUF1311 family)